MRRIVPVYWAHPQSEPPARNRSPREARDPARQALRPGCEELAVFDAAQMPVREARPRGPKPPRWSADPPSPRLWRAIHLPAEASAKAGRRASRVISAFTRVLTRYGTQGASQAPDTPRYGVSNGCRCTRTTLGAPPTPRFGVSEATMQTPGRRNAPREGGGVCA